ncbi:histidine phosphatase family protein [Patescibacteria group bacterium]
MTNEMKTIIVARHGSIHNPNNIVYNRDEVMDPKDIIHLSDKGVQQIRDLALLIKEQGLAAKMVHSSPSVRAQESAQILRDELDLDEIRLVKDLDDSFAPGPYREGMTMDKLKEIGGNVYSEYWRKEHGHESPEDIIVRMKKAFDDMFNSLQPDEVGILVSHGDTISWLVNSLDSNKEPTPENFRKLHYPAKGEATVIMVGENGEIVNISFLNQSSSETY